MDRFEKGLELLGITASGTEMDKLGLYTDELLLWNSRLNLVSTDNREEIITRHILDCLAGLNIIDNLQGESIADVGSGAGLPGLLLSIFMEERHFTLIERSGKKAGFLRTASAMLGLRGRVNVADRDLGSVTERFDIVTMRAFRNFGDFFPVLKGITAESGSIAAYKGRMDVIRDELEDASIDESAYKILPLQVPFLEEPRHLVVITV